MSEWRKQADHKSETKAVKDALLKAGIKARVGHGTGTAHSWLKIHLEAVDLPAHDPDPSVDIRAHVPYRCPRCSALHAIADRAEKIAQDVTGRHGEYGGCINVHYPM